MRSIQEEKKILQEQPSNRTFSFITFAQHWRDTYVPPNRKSTDNGVLLDVMLKCIRKVLWQSCVSIEIKKLLSTCLHLSILICNFLWIPGKPCCCSSTPLNWDVWEDFVLYQIHTSIRSAQPLLDHLISFTWVISL